MKRLLATITVLGMGFVCADRAFTQSKPRATASIEGVWKGTSIVTTDANGRPATDPNRAQDVLNRQPNIFIYTRGYSFQIRQDSLTSEPDRLPLAPPKDPNNLTDTEKLARYEHWRPVAAAAGRYEVKGTTLYMYTLVSRNQSADIITRNETGRMGTIPEAALLEVRFEDNNTMVQIEKSADRKYQARRTYTRLESAADVEARPPAAPSIAGVWMSTSYVATGANPVANPKRQPNIVIYTKGYYGSVRQDSDTTPPLPLRPVLVPPKDPNHLTDAEKLARYEHWAPVSADAGRYEVKGTTFYQFPLISKNQSAAIISRNQTGDNGTIAPNSEIRFEGNNTMVQVAKSVDGKSETRRTYTRLE